MFDLEKNECHDHGIQRSLRCLSMAKIRKSASKNVIILARTLTVFEVLAFKMFTLESLGQSCCITSAMAPFDCKY